jgi:Amt family ammonium transporter
MHDVAPAIDPGSAAWMLTFTALILFMTMPGLALFYRGLLRTRSGCCSMRMTTVS